MCSQAPWCGMTQWSRNAEAKVLQKTVVKASICSLIHPVTGLYINFLNHVHSYTPFSVATAFTHSNSCHVCINPTVMASLLLKLMLASVLSKCPELKLSEVWFASILLQ